MGKIILLFLIAVTALTTLARPWIGIISYYLLALLGPQYIWWWNFEGLRVSFIVAVFTLLGIGCQVLRKNSDFNFMITRQNFWLLVLWIFIALSYYLGPYVSMHGPSSLSPKQLFSITNSIFIFYFCASLTINNLEKLRFLSMVLPISTLYLIYWANLQYLSSNWHYFNMGRLMGPSSLDGGSIYCDENTFAMLFVTGLPFLYYMGFQIRRKLFRYALWSFIPLGWHAVFLTGSRGGLLGLCAIILLTVLNSKKKILALPVLLLFIFFYQWQAGSTMKERSETITNSEESSSEARLIAWKGGAGMIEAYPLFGVGFGGFKNALPYFIESKPRVAHNTLVQYAAESGIVAGFSYLVLVYLFFANSRRISAWCRQQPEHPDNLRIQYLNNASVTSFAGLIVCSLFLSLNTYENFFYLLIINNTLMVLCRKEQNSVEFYELCKANPSLPVTT